MTRCRTDQNFGHSPIYLTRVTLESASASNFSAKANKSTITFSTSGIFAGFDPSSPSAKQSTYIMCSYTTSSIYGPVNHHNQAGLGSMRETFGKERGGRSALAPGRLEVWDQLQAGASLKFDILVHVFPCME